MEETFKGPLSVRQDGYKKRLSIYLSMHPMNLAH